MKLYRLGIIRGVTALTCLFAISLAPLSYAKPSAGLTAKSAMVMNKRGTIVFKKNPYERLPAASTAKVLTAIIAVERLKLDAPVTISRRAAGMAPSKAYLPQGATYPAGELIKALLMSSANDAGTAIAEAVAGSELKFAQLMNQRARLLGANNSFFLNATGLPEGKKRQYSTVYDLALFMKKASTYPFLVEVMKTKKSSICGSDGKAIYLRNHNKFLWRTAHDLIGKTGYTLKAKHCFLGMFSKGKKSFIIAIQGSRKPWDDLEYLMNRRY